MECGLGGNNKYKDKREPTPLSASNFRNPDYDLILEIKFNHVC